MWSFRSWRFRTAPEFSPITFLVQLFFCLGCFLPFSITLKAQCPSIAAIMIDACGLEQNNEFVVINSGGGFNVSDLQLDYDVNNNILSNQNNDINIDNGNLPGGPCGLQAGNPAFITGCTNVIPAGPGTLIPANSYVILECSSGANNGTYNFAAVCGAQPCIYVIQSTCARTAGGFTNGGGGGLRTQTLSTTTGCSTTYVYDRALLIGGNGADFIPPATYGNPGCSAPPVAFGNQPVTPVISGIPASICQTDPSIALPTTLSGIMGNWSGTGVTANNFNPSGLGGNITLTFTHIATQCANVVSTTINVIVPTTPAITGIPASICQSAASIALPTTQSGITGTWSGMGVSGNNFNPSGLSGNITLTFTVTAGQCANNNTTTITVNTPVTPPISGIQMNICENASSIALNTTQSGITGTWSGTGVAGNNFNPSGLSGNIILTFTPTAGQCANNNTTFIFVNIPVVPAISGIPATICETASSIALPTTQSGITGSWSGTGVAGNNFNPSGLSGNITLTFTPTVGQCANPATTSITVNTPTAPAISGIPANICESAASIALPVTQSGINGTWSGTGVSGNSFNPSGLSGNITLTFTPTAGQCAIANTTTITVNSLTTPLISGVPASICQSASSISLATIQSGITGTWSGMGVTANNFNPTGLSGNITLTFTPNAGQCANPNTTTITVNIPVTPAISGIPASLCANAAVIFLPTTQSGITGTWSGTGVAGNNFNPTGLNGNITLTFTPAAGQCANINTTTITVNTPVTPVVSGIPASICENSTSIALPTTQSGITGNWSGTGVVSNNFSPTGLSGNITLTFTPTIGQCANIVMTSILVNTPITPAITGIPATICQSAASIALPTTQSGITGSWSGTGVAANNFNPTGLSGNITLTFTPTAGQCAVVNTTTITVNLPVTPAINGIPANICQTAAPISLPSVQSGITGNWSGMGVAGNNFNPAGLSGSIILTFTPNTGQCANNSTTNILVNVPSVPAISGIPNNACENGANINLPTTQSGVAGTWSGQGVVANSFDPSGLSGNIILTFTPNAGQCANPATTSITIHSPPTFQNLMVVCNGSNTTYTVSFMITGGSPGTYTVNGMPVGGSTFTSGPINSGTPYSFMLNDANNCGPVVINGTHNCSCTTFAGTMNFANTPYQICDGSGFTVVPNGNDILDANDVLEFIIHTNPGGQLGTIIAISATPTFSFPGSVVLGQTYYVSAVAGSNNGSGGVDLNDPCLSVSQGVPVIFYAPSVTFTSGGSLCENECFVFQVQFTGFAPFNLMYEVNAGGNITNLNLSSPTNISSVTICPSDFGFNNGTLQVYPTDLTDENCSVAINNPVIQNLDVSPNPVNNLTQSLCTGQSITINGTVYNQANPFGTEVLLHAGSNGCDSVININLMFHPVVVFNLNQTLCTGGNVIVNGNLYDQAHPTGTETIVNGSSNGCDSIINVSLSFNNVVTFNLIQTICSDDNIVINGTTYDVAHPAGSETFIGGSYLGCDSVVNINLSFYPPATFNLAQTLCTGGSVTVNGIVFNQANPMGTETIPNASIHGCDSLVHVDLAFSSVVTNNITQTLCPNGFVAVNGNFYNAGNPTGTETIIGGSFLGCDSVININLSFYPPSTFNLFQTLCSGQSIVVNGTTYDEATPIGTEILSNASILGCDSLVNINLNFITGTSFNLNQTLCSGGSVMVNGTTYNAANPVGSTTIIGGNYLGCDSTVNVNLSFYPPSVSNLNQTICPGGSITVNGTIYNQGHPNGAEIISNASSHGCDSTVNVSLSFYPPSVFNLNQTLCVGGSITVNGTVYNQGHPNGSEIFANAGAHGCDSTVNVSLNFISSTTFLLDPEICEGGSVIVNGTTYNSGNPTGSETFVGGNYLGCDSVVNILLTFYSPAIYTLDSTLASGQSVILNGNTYGQSNPIGLETIIGGSSKGCDSIIMISLHFDNSFAADVTFESPLCRGGNDGLITIEGISGGLPPYTVTVNIGSPVSIGTFPFVLSGLVAGIYHLSIEDATGTIFTKDVTIPSAPILTLDLGNNISINPGENVTLSGQASFPVNMWSWSPPTFLDCTDCAQPTVTSLTENTTYTLLAMDINGCSVRDSVTVFLIKSHDIFVPTLFHPNGDQLNDVLFINTGDHDAMVKNFVIFNRWGDMVYQVQNIFANDISKGWDGTYRNEKLNPGVYVWIAEIEFTDGEKAIFKGDVTLIH
ncbi:MAG: gliding motility-associated C-terminal domain-containing protein [Saprospiraceae bacterium]